MPVTINGDGSITGLSVGGLGSGVVNTATLADGAATGVKKGAGSILQVQSTLKTDSSNFTLSGGALSSILFSVNITPSSASNKILIHAHCSIGLHSDSEGQFSMELTKAGSSYTTLAGDAYGSSSRVLAVGYAGEGNQMIYDQQTIAATAMDVGGSTSAITYGIAVRLRDNGSCEGRINRHTAADQNAWDFMPTSGITVMEIAV